MPPTITTALAVWASVLATSTLAWNIWTWIRGRPRIKATVQVQGPPGDQVILFEIRNRGDKPTTIEKVYLVHYQAGLWGYLGHWEHIEYVAGKYRETAQLPALLAPGECWTGTAPLAQDHLPGSLDKLPLIKRGRLHFKIQCSHTDRRLSGKVQAETTDLRI